MAATVGKYVFLFSLSSNTFLRFFNDKITCVRDKIYYLMPLTDIEPTGILTLFFSHRSYTTNAFHTLEDFDKALKIPLKN